MADNWQPIATAPRDGTVLLLWDFDWDVPFIGYCKDDSWIDVGEGSYVTTSHWMPLPPPPQQETDRE